METKINHWTFPALPRNDEVIADQIINDLNEFAEVDLKMRTRKRDVLEPRQVACYLIRQNTELSLMKIGKILGIDHSSVIHSVDVVRELRKYDKVFAERWKEWLVKRYRPRIETNFNTNDYEQQNKIGEEQD